MIGCKSLTNLEIAALQKNLSMRDFTLLNLGLKTGFRITELLSLKISELYESNGQLKDSITVMKRNMKGKKRSRSVPFSIEARAELSNYLKTLPASQEWLFQSNRDVPLSRYQAWRAIKLAAKKANLIGKIGTHSWRKSLAMNAYKSSNKDLALVQRILGHSNIQSTISYLQIEPEQLEKVWKELQK